MKTALVVAVVGLVCLVAAAFLVSVPLGVAAVGVSLLAVGLLAIPAGDE